MKKFIIAVFIMVLFASPILAEKTEVVKEIVIEKEQTVKEYLTERLAELEAIQIKAQENLVNFEDRVVRQKQLNMKLQGAIENCKIGLQVISDKEALKKAAAKKDNKKKADDGKGKKGKK